jgi:hypothetical protein
VRCQCVVARLPSSSPASASTKIPEQTLAMRVPRLATALTKLLTHVLRAAASTPSPPEMISVVIALGGPNLRASISAPDVLRTGPGLADMTRIGVSIRA